MRYEVYARTLRPSAGIDNGYDPIKRLCRQSGESNRVPIVYSRAFTEYPRAEILISLQRLLIL